MKQDAVDWIRRSPERFASLTAQRAVNFWFGPLEEPVFAAVVAGLSLCGFFAIYRMCERLGVLEAILFLVPLITYPLAYYIVQFSGRYRIPIRWIVVLAACWFAYDVLRQRGASNAGHRVRRADDSGPRPAPERRPRSH
jgi:hypothetical protein